MATRFDIGYYLISPLALPYFAYRRWSKGKYRESGPAMLGKLLPRGEDRTGFQNGSIWIHAVSVGEVVAAKSIVPLVQHLAPQLPLVVTTITETGQAHARKILPEADHISYYPIDFSWNVAKFLDCFNPKIVILIESDMWPNFLIQSAARGAKVFLVNGDVSEKSFKQYRRFLPILKPAFDSITAYCMQTEADAERMRVLCRRPGDMYVTGNIKFDSLPEPLSDDEKQRYRERFRLGSKRPCFVVGSTHPGEEEIMLDAFEKARQAIPDLQMILSPRHPERFNEVAALFERKAAQRNPPWRVSRASNPSVDSPDVFILDVMGELARIYGLGDMAVVAGSFVPVGGHSLLEPAVHSIPVITGPHMHGQKEMDRLFEGRQSGCIRCDSQNLANSLLMLLMDEAERKNLGSFAKKTSSRNRGSAKASIDAIEQYLCQPR